ncbi:DUF4129 domain-containing transglutaminase family protein [Paenibacillus chartarius]|uniref:DUF4129 domain-containing transglutaminase family protein n=1 Tax=Paenibacillus chartarius TaxID=747481 RepID=A0ABV6DTK0_9BACL
MFAAKPTAAAGPGAHARRSAPPIPAPPVWKLLGVSLLLFLLVREWLLPLPELSPVTELYDIRPFLVLFGLTLLLDGLRVPAAAGAPLKGALTVGLVGFLFYGESLFRLTWLPQLALQVWQDIQYALQAEYELIGGETRTLLFAAGWCMMVSVLHVLLVQRQQAVWLGGITVLYLLLLQLIFGVDTTFGVLRAFGWSGLLLALLMPDRLFRQRGMELGPEAAFRWSIAAAGALALCAAVGWFGWKPADVTAGRVMKPLGDTLIQGWTFPAANTEWPPAALVSSAVSLTGYSSDDTELGGPVRPDDGIALEARTNELTYWRGESRDLYTGRGWRSSAEESVPLSLPARPQEPAQQSQSQQLLQSGQQPQSPPPQLQAQQQSQSQQPEPQSRPQPNAGDNLLRQEVMLPQGRAGRVIFTGGTVTGIDALLSTQNRLIPFESVRYSPVSGSYTLPPDAESAAYYRIEAEPFPPPSEAQLQADTQPYPAVIIERYLQLPPSLPGRVKQLAQAAASDASTPYAKVMAIRQLLRSGTYSYSMSSPTVPADGADFVDHFLFTDKTGYCDHFSSAMVVMLRSVGVPARWVKGYSPGTEQGSPGEDGMHTVVVRNRDAHSWVEVYFTGAGWVTFDPTPGYGPETATGAISQPVSAASGADGSIGAAQDIIRSASNPAASTAPAAQQPQQSVSLAGITAGTLHKLESAYRIAAAALLRKPWLAALTAFGLAAAAVGAYFAGKHFKATPPLPIVPLKRNDSHALLDRLWRRIYRMYGPKSPQETTREYVARIAGSDPARSAALLEFARLDELTRYDPQRRRPIARSMLQELWRRIRQTA